ncbi:glycosyltransferase family 2 protein [Roseovarius sp. EL26]|uniref:glycosyltransferase n=1 Tax=Roseovarius sp. EL26 TaxID=2126672 RepID=UPI000EA3EA87|nr:glycosyltransferase family A protein [Roseovarius sp. EL26]
MSNTPDKSRKYLLISPCRNEQDYMRQTLDTVIAQSETPALWVIVDDGSTDDTPEILADYAARHDWIKIVQKPNRGHRAVGPGVVEAFYFGLNSVDMDAFDYLCKLDLDLALPPKYFATLMDRMETEPRLGSCSGKPYFTNDAGRMISEKCGDDMSVGMTKFYRRECFQQIGGFVQEVMWDAIDCHKSRQLGWTVLSWDAPEIRFEHLRPMGSSQKGVLTGRMRHGYGQYYMGSDPLYFTATAIFRMAHPPYVIGGLATFWGYWRSFISRPKKQSDQELAAFIRRYQRLVLRMGKGKAVAKIEAEQAHLWTATYGA